MKAILFSSSKSNHSGYVSCSLWITNELVVTCGDDQKLLFWNSLSPNEPIKSISLSIDGFPTCMDYHSTQTPGTDLSSTSFVLISNIKIESTANQIAIGATNGSFYLIPINWNGNKLEKSFKAHKGSIIVIRWSNDNSTLATAGEDGLIKIWSKVGMLRSTITVSNVLPVHAMSWSPDSNSLVYVNHKKLIIKSLSPQSKALEWIAHDRLITNIDWSLINNRILTVSEDGRVKIWEPDGRLLYFSGSHASPITSIRWSPDGELFAVSTFNSIKLHDSLGHCFHVEKLLLEGISFISWSLDSNQICLVCTNGQVLFVNIIDKVVEWKFWQVSNRSRRTIKVSNTTNDFSEVLEFKDSILRFSFQFDHLLITTKNQCFIYQLNNLTTPHYFDIKKTNGTILMLKQSHKYFALINLNGAQVYTYDGRLIKTIKLSNLRPETLRANYFSLNDQILAHKDGINGQIIHFIYLENQSKISNYSGKSELSNPNQYQHPLEIINIKLNTELKNPQRNDFNDNDESYQLCALLDKNSDLYILSHNQRQIKIFKLSTMIRDLYWHVDYNILACLHENKKNISIWLYPNAVFLDSSLLQEVLLTITSNDISSNGKIVEFSKNRITIEQQDRVKICLTINPFIILLHKHRQENRLDEAVRMCNFLDKSIHEIEPLEKNVRDSLWATLSVMSLEEKKFRIAEVTYAAIDNLDKVLYLNQINSLPSKEIISIEFELLIGNVELAEQLLIQKGYILRAVQLQLQLYHWKRALELAEKFNNRFNNFTVELSKKAEKDKSNFNDDFTEEIEPLPKNITVDLVHLVLSCRENYLRIRNKQETLEQFQKLFNENEHLAEWNKIDEKLKENFFAYTII